MVETHSTGVGQVVGQMTTVRKTKDVIRELVEEYVEATDRLFKLEGG